MATATAIAQRTATAPGDQFALAVILNLEEGWHAWPNKPVVPPGVEDLVPIPTELHIDQAALPAGVTVHTDKAQWPTPTTVESAGFTGTPIKVQSLAGSAVIYIPVTVSQGVKAGKVTVPIEISYQACNDSTCMPLTTAAASASFEILPAGGAVRNSPDEKVFAAFKPAVFAEIRGSAAPPPAPDGAPANPPAASASGETAPSLFGYRLPDPRGPVGLLVLFLFSVLGGAVMNLTPCVLPVIPIKVMTLTQHAGAKDGTLKLGIWMALGVVAFWAAVGVPMAFFSAALDPTRLIFGHWWASFTIGLLIALMGLGIMGLYTITLPQSAYMINPKVDTPQGSFVFGIMTAILGLPCFGFVAGGLLVGATTLPPSTIMIIFIGLGVGMASPYVVLAAKPALVHKIPRTGPASELVKEIMGLLLLAAATFFVTVGLQTLVKEKPYIGPSLQYWGAAFFLVLAAAWLIVQTFRITRKPMRRAVIVVLALLAAGATVAFAVTDTASNRRDYLKHQSTSEGDTSFLTNAWNEYTPARFAAARASGKTVIADFTASWCLICKSLKRGVLDQEPVHSALMGPDTVPFEVDLSSDSAPGWALLGSIGRTGIPTLAIFPPGDAPPIVLNAYTSDTVMESLRKLAK